MSSLASSKTSHEMPAAGATFARFVSEPCRRGRRERGGSVAGAWEASAVNGRRASRDGRRPTPHNQHARRGAGHPALALYRPRTPSCAIVLRNTSIMPRYLIGRPPMPCACAGEEAERATEAGAERVEAGRRRGTAGHPQPSRRLQQAGVQPAAGACLQARAREGQRVGRELGYRGGAHAGGQDEVGGRVGALVLQGRRGSTGGGAGGGGGCQEGAATAPLRALVQERRRKAQRSRHGGRSRGSPRPAAALSASRKS